MINNLVFFLVNNTLTPIKLSIFQKILGYLKRKIVRTFHSNNAIILLNSLSILLLLQACQNNNDPDIAIVGEDNIRQSDFIERYEDYIIQTGIKDNIISRKEVLNSMITELLLKNYDNNDIIDNNNEYQKELAWTQNQTILGYLKDREIYAKIDASDKELREAFLRSNQKIAARHLFAPTEEEINNIAELLKIGVDFNTLAKQTFTDSTLRENGGYLGYFSWGDMEPEFEDVAFSMKVGEISEPIKTKHGFSIIKLEDRVSHPLLTENEFQQKKSKLSQILRIRKKRPSEKEYVNKVVQFDEITLNDKSINKIWESIELKINGEKEIPIIFSDTIAVKYKEKEYSENEIQKRIYRIPEFHFRKINSKKNLETVIKGIVLQDQLLEIADEKNYDSNELVEKTFQKASTNLFMKYKISEIIDNYNIEDSVVFDFYKNHPDFFSTHEQINVQEILVNDLELAEELVKKLKNGEDFGKLARNFSIRKITAENDGKIGLTPIQKFGNLKNIFKQSALNKVIGPIQIEEIYGIFKVLEKKESEPVEFEKAKETALLAVKFKLKNEILASYVEKLKAKINIDINLKNLGSAKVFQTI
ncbi:MAG: peptidylprolyl isomerase [Ignavibacteriales bacterium]|nr:peptidylprolyl isomerase [Ignavibacteriales bacterium]